MKQRVKSIFQMILSTLLLLIVQSCITVETDMNINKNLAGSSVSKISIMKGFLTEDQLRIEIEKLGFKKYDLKKEKNENSEIDRYTVGINWKTEEELKNILKFIGSGSAIGLSEMQENLEKLSELGGTQANKEGTSKGAISGKENSKDEAKSGNPTGIFTKSKGIVTVNMGKSNINRLTIKVAGKIITEENQQGKVSEKKDEITFYQGEDIKFRYKESGGLIGGLLKIIIIAGFLFLSLVGFFVVKNLLGKKDRKKENLDETEIEEDIEGENIEDTEDIKKSEDIQAKNIQNNEEDLKTEDAE